MSDSNTPKTWRDDLAEARQHLDALRESLPDKVEVAALGVTSKAPFQILSVREPLIWRTEELARNACDALDREDFTIAALAIRGVAECTAMVWYLLSVLEDRAKHKPSELNDILMRMFAGSKNGWSEGPEAINVLTFVNKFDKKVPGFEQAYLSLCEYAHPNWLGVSGLYSRIDYKNYTAHFGRCPRPEGAERAGRQLVNALIGGLVAFQGGYNLISDEMPAFIDELEKF